MPATLIRRSLEDRSLTEQAGERIQEWIASRSPEAVFAVAVVSCFVAFLVVASAFWLSIRRCRSPRSPRDRWHHLSDGSSVRTRDGAYAGPVGTLIREGYADAEPAYAPARISQPTTEMRQDAYAMTGRYGAYDPPLMAHRGSPGPLALSREQDTSAAPSAAPRPRSDATFQSSSSEQTKVGDEQLKRPHLMSSLSLPGPPPPPPVVPINSVTVSGFVPYGPTPIRSATHTSAPSISKSLATGVELPLPGSPRTSSDPSPRLDEAAFSTPKPTPSPAATSKAPARLTHTRSASSTSGGFTPMPLALSSSAGAISSTQAPKVELKRTWSIGTWIPQLKDGAGSTGREGVEQTESSVAK